MGQHRNIFGISVEYYTQNNNLPSQAKEHSGTDEPQTEANTKYLKTKAMAHKFINEIEPGDAIDDIYLVKEPLLRKTSRGDFYIAMFLCDRTGQLNGRMWRGATEAVYQELTKSVVVRIQGRSELYQNNVQVVVNGISALEEGAFSRKNLEKLLVGPPSYSQETESVIYIDSNEFSNGKTWQLLTAIVNDSKRQGVKCEKARTLRTLQERLKEAVLRYGKLDYKNLAKSLKYTNGLVYTTIPCGKVVILPKKSKEKVGSKTRQHLTKTRQLV